MAINPIPPQAYTKETLLKAYAWLMNQSPSIKEMATTPDILVSLFLKAQRNGEDSLDRPSIQNFKNELKNLAGLMGELEEKPAQNHAAGVSFAPYVNSSTTPPPMAPQFTAPAANSPSATAPSIIVSSPMPPSGEGLIRANPSIASTTSTSVSAGMITTKVSQTTTTVEANSTRSFLDTKTMEMLEEARVAFNLSSEEEALRMLVTLGYNKAKGLF